MMALAKKNATFEIQVMRNGRWNTESYMDEENAAVGSARRYLNDKACEGVRVVRNWNRADGQFVEKEIFSHTRSVQDDGPVRIVPVDNAPPRCQDNHDYFAPPSRAVMNRVFRTYLDKVFVTPSEILHNYRELKRLQEKDLLVPSAVDRIALLQTRDRDQDSKDRRDEIYHNIDQFSARARRAEALKLPKLDGSMSALLRKIGEFSADDDTDYLALVVLSRDLLNVRNWLGKLEQLCRLAVDEGDGKALSLLDGVISDVLGSNVVQDVLGTQDSLAHAICAMLDLSEGRLNIRQGLAAESAAILNGLLADGKLPSSRAVLIDRALRQLKSPNPLYRHDPTREREALTMVVQRLVTPDGLLHGGEAAEALTLRAACLGEEGGATGRRLGIGHILGVMPDRAFGLIYLCELARTHTGREHAADIANFCGRVEDARALNGLCHATLNNKERLARATLAHRTVLASPLPADQRHRLAGHIDLVMERYLVDEQVVEKLDHPDHPLRDRALRLVQFCASGLLPDGRALALARGRVVALLRSPNFDARFVDGIADPAKAQNSLREFHQMLLRAGFGA